MADLTTAPALRRPRGIVKINDEAVAGWLEADIDTNGFYSADTFTVTFPAGVIDLEALVELPAVKVEILAGFPADPLQYDASELTSLIIGNVDDIDFDTLTRIVTLSGRDYTSYFIDAKTTEKWPNQTASEIAEMLAQRHGLSSAVVATTVKVGRYYEIDEVRLTDARTEWDLLTYLANESLTDDGRKFVVYVCGTTLYFEPEPSPDDEPVVLRWEESEQGRAFRVAPVTTMTFKRSLTVLKDVVVTVKSWSQKQKKAVTAVYPTQADAGAADADSAQPGEATPSRTLYEYRFANLTQEQALQKAQAIHRDLTLQEVRMQARLPADNDLSPRKLIKVVGTGTIFDQTYYPESVRRVMSQSDGYWMTVSAKNRSPETEVSL